MIVAVIPRLEVDGVIVNCEEVCRFFEEISDREAEDFVRYIFRHKSQEVFLFYVQGLIYKVILRYLRLGDVEVEDLYDLVSECVSSVLEKVREYEEGKGKLISYVYTIVRGVVTKYLHRMQERRRVEYSDALFYRNGEVDVSGVDDGGYGLEYDGIGKEDEIEVRVRVWERVKERMFGRKRGN